MNPAMKQRLVGTIVLGSLALILIPLLLDGEGVERPPLTASMPPAPVIDTTPAPQPERPVILADTLVEPPAPEAAVPEELPADSEANSPPPSDAVPAEAEVAVAAPEPQTAATSAASNSEPALDAAGLPEGWTVRLGSFGSRANADALVARLLAAGHKAYIRPVVTGQGSLNGVFVGPVLTRNEAVALRSELASRLQLDGIVQEFDIAQ